MRVILVQICSRLKISQPVLSGLYFLLAEGELNCISIFLIYPHEVLFVFVQNLKIFFPLFRSTCTETFIVLYGPSDADPPKYSLHDSYSSIVQKENTCPFLWVSLKIGVTNSTKNEGILSRDGQKECMKFINNHFMCEPS